jgi:hypothetical protein
MEKISRQSPYNQTLLHTGSKIAAVPNAPLSQWAFSKCFGIALEFEAQQRTDEVSRKCQFDGVDVSEGVQQAGY